jgi:hypothetical protein
MADKDFRVKLGLHVGANAYIEGNITSVDLVQMNVASPATVGGAGQLAWNTTDRTLDIGVNANTTLQVGQEQYYYVRNHTAVTIPDGTAVMANGVGGANRIHIEPAIANGSVPPKYILGITTEEIAAGQTGFVTSFGKVRNLNTSMFSEGDILYASPNTYGGLSNTIPIAPNNIVTLAIVTNKSASTGELFVRPIYGSTLYENEDVHLESVSDGQALVYVTANARFENKNVAAASSNSFTTISVSGQSNVVADSSTDTLTLAAGTGISLTTDAATDTITITSTSSGGDASNAWVNANDYSTLLSARSNDFNTLQTAYANDYATLLTAQANDFNTLLSARSNDYATLLSAQANDGVTLLNARSNDYATLLSAYANDFALYSSVRSFNAFVVAGQSDVVADGFTDTVTLVAGTGISLTTNAAADSITIASIGPRLVYLADSTSITVNTDTTDVAQQNNTQAVGTLTVNAPTGTITDSEKFILRIKSTNVQTFSWNGVFAGSTDGSLPTVTSGAGKTDYMGFMYMTADTKWHMIAKNFGF